jgi:formate dehydrogenase subunit gamma
VVSRRPLVKAIHIYTAVAWAVALVLIALVGDRRSLARTVHEIDRFDADDRAWLARRGAPQGRLNAGQKLNAVITAAFALLFVVTGFFLWYGERNTRFRLPNALLVHDWLMYVSFFLFMGHLFLAVIYPKTRHALNGITRGWVDEDWALQHHRKWVEQLHEQEAAALEP